MSACLPVGYSEIIGQPDDRAHTDDRWITGGKILFLDIFKIHQITSLSLFFLRAESSVIDENCFVEQCCVPGEGSPHASTGPGGGGGGGWGWGGGGHVIRLWAHQPVAYHLADTKSIALQNCLSISHSASVTLLLPYNQRRLFGCETAWVILNRFKLF